MPSSGDDVSKTVRPMGTNGKRTSKGPRKMWPGVVEGVVERLGKQEWRTIVRVREKRRQKLLEGIRGQKKKKNIFNRKLRKLKTNIT